MSRILLVVLVIVVVVLGVGYVVRSHRAPTLQIAALLPRETVAIAHVPDFNKTRGEWHESEIYRLYQEPSVQEFLRKPLSRIPTTGNYPERRRQLEQLDPKDAFLAVTSIANDRPIVAAGFRYHGSQADAEKIIGDWRAKLLGKAPGTSTSETMTYDKAQLQVTHIQNATICSVYSGPWFFIANDVDLLKSLVDRTGGTNKAAPDSLATDDNFRKAMAHLPPAYSFSFYVQPHAFMEKLSALRQSNPALAASPQLDLLAQIRSFCGATRFEGGKMHDFFFAEMPELVKGGINRSSLALTTANTFFYATSLLDLSRQFGMVDPAPGAAFLGAKLQNIGRGLAAAGITAKEWESVFGNEIGAAAEWAPDSHWPAALIAFPVKDATKAKPIAVSLARILDDDAQWVEADVDGVHYISSVYRAGFVALNPTIAVSDRFLVFGLDPVAIQNVMKRLKDGAATLSGEAGFKDAARMLPAPTQSFTYVDPGLLYGRLDAALRPMLMMGAAFMPAMNDYVDISKLPDPETIKRHLSPIVGSQRYDQNGYASESIGPLTLSQAGTVLIGGAVAGAIGYRVQTQHSAPAQWNPGGAGSAPASPGWPGHGTRIRPSLAPSPSPAGTP